MRKILKKDIVIPAGTIFSKAPIKTVRYGDCHFEAVFGLTNDTYGTIEYCFDKLDQGTDEWFEDYTRKIPTQSTNIPIEEGRVQFPEKVEVSKIQRY